MEEIFYGMLALAALAIPVIFLVLIIVYISKTNALSRQVQALEWKVNGLNEALKHSGSMPAREQSADQLQADPGKSQAPGFSVIRPPTIPPAPYSIPPPPSRAQEPVPRPPVIQQPPPQAQRPSISAPPPPSARVDQISFTERDRAASFEPKKPARSRREWEALIGGRLMNWIGAVALVIGFGSFLLYAFQRNLIPPWGRVGIGYAAGIGLLALASRFHKKGLSKFAQGLLGAGISILYLSAYATFNLYALVTQIVAFLIMAAITALTFIIGIKYNSLAVVFLGWLGGFLTPRLLSTGTANETGLFSYIALLDVGLIAILIVKDRWVVLEPLTLGATYVYYILWYSRFYRELDLPITVVFLTVFWVLFYALDVSRTVRPAKSFQEVRQITGAFNGVLYYTGMYSIINPLHHELMGWITATIGVVYLLTALAARRVTGNDPLAFARNVLTAVVLMVLATTIEFTGFKTVFFWSLEAAVLVWCGLHWDLKYVWRSGLALFALALGKLILTDGAFSLEPETRFKLLWNSRALAFAALAGSIGFSAHLFARARHNRIRSILHHVWGVIVFALVTVETDDQFKHVIANSREGSTEGLRFIQSMTMPLVWIAYSLPMVWAGLKTRAQAVVNCGLAAAGLAVLFGLTRGLAFEPIQNFSLLINYRAGALLIIMAALATQGVWLAARDQDEKWIRQVIGVILAALCICLFELCTAETHDQFRFLKNGATPETASALSFTEAMTLVVVWTAYSAPLVWAGLRKKLMPVFVIGMMAAGLVVVFGGIEGFSFVPIERFTLIANQRLAALVLAIAGLIVIEHLLRREREGYGWAGTLLPIMRTGIPLLILILATSETKDYFDREIARLSGGLPGNSAALTSLFNLKQMMLSLVWLVYSIFVIFYGIWRRLASVRTLAIVIFGVSILKIFFYDLRFLETLYRIFSFMGLGVIMLIVSYVYNRFKDFIFPPSTETEPPLPASAE